MPEIKSKRPRLQFSLRTVFLLITLCCGWLAYHLNWIRHRHHFLAEVYQPDNEGTPYSDGLAPWPLRMLGESTWDGLFVPSQRADEAAALFPEAKLLIVAPERVR